MEAYIYDILRTPRGRGNDKGALLGCTPVYLLRQLFDAYRQRNPLLPALTEEVILGCVTQTMEQGANVAKTAAQAANWGEHLTGVSLNRFCGSGLEAINQAAAYVASGCAELILAGGVESMSRVPMGADGGAMAYDPSVAMEGLFIPQGISADLIASKYGYSRRLLDEFAAESQKRAAAAQKAGYFNRSIVPIHDINGLLLLAHDENVRESTTAESLSTLRPAFETIGEMGGFDAVALDRYPEVERIHHPHHAGNSSAIVDGAAMALIGSKAIGEKLGMRPRARIRTLATIGTDPTIMLLGPAPASRKALQRAGMQASDIDLFEINEAFAAVVVRFMEDMRVAHDKVNVNGGAIALGHPLGATGCMLTATALDELERRDKETALISLCIGGGMGIATIIERL